jgi:hypothetical protein
VILALSTSSKTVSNRLIPTIFHEDWWLEAATGGEYDVVEVRANDRMVGRLPYFVQKRAGLRRVVMPTLTHFLGPAVDEGAGNAITRALKRRDITKELISQLPSLPSIRIKCHRDVTDVISFQEEGFQTSVQFTHELAPAPPETLWANMRDKVRNVIRRSEAQVAVEVLHDPKEFQLFYNNNITKRDRANYLDPGRSLAVITAALEHQRGQILATRDAQGRLTAAAFCVWDEQVAYYLMTTRTADAGNGDVSLLVWKFVQEAAGRGLVFDFDGVSSVGSVLFFTGFGAAVCPRYVVTRSTPWMRMLLEARDIVRPNPFCG